MPGNYVMLSAVICAACSGLSYWLFNPFYIPEALRDFIFLTNTGTVLSAALVLVIVQIIASFLIGESVRCKSGKTIYLFWTLLNGGGCLIITIFIHLHDFHSLPAMYCMMTALQALGSSCIMISLMAIISMFFEEKKALWLLFNEMCFGLGLALGPVLGLFQFKGFPFDFSGIFVLISTIKVLLAIYFQDKEEDPTNDIFGKSAMDLLKLPGRWMGLLSPALHSTADPLWNSAIEDQLLPFDLSTVLFVLLFIGQGNTRLVDPWDSGQVAFCYLKIFSDPGGFVGSLKSLQRYLPKRNRVK